MQLYLVLIVYVIMMMIVFSGHHLYELSFVSMTCCVFFAMAFFVAMAFVLFVIN